MRIDNNQQVFFALVRAGLWEVNVQLLPYGNVNWDEVYRLAQEQSVLGLVAAGLEHVTDVKAPKMVSLQFVGDALVLEEHNKAMNDFIADLVDKMRAEGIYTLLVKGQGVAQCYERPLWRACGDVDLLLNDSNYKKAKAYLIPLASSVETEGEYKQHQGMTIDSWVVELHGNLRCGLSSRMDRCIDDIQNDVFNNGNVRSWMCGNTQVFLPGINSDVLFVFTHFIKHFYCEGLGLRQICDWRRLLWTYRASLDLRILESRIKQMGLMTEWKAFYNLANRYLGMPDLGSGLMVHDSRYDKKADRICEFIMNVGNFGHNRDNSHIKYPYMVRKLFSLGRRCGDLMRHARIFPWDPIRFMPKIVYNGLKSAAKGE